MIRNVLKLKDAARLCTRCRLFVYNQLIICCFRWMLLQTWLNAFLPFLTWRHWLFDSYTLFARKLVTVHLVWVSFIPIRSSVRLKYTAHLSTPCLHVVWAVWTQQVVSCGSIISLSVMQLFKSAWTLLPFLWDWTHFSIALFMSM